MLEIISTSLLDNSYIEIQFREILHCDVLLAAMFFSLSNQTIINNNNKNRRYEKPFLELINVCSTSHTIHFIYGLSIKYTAATATFFQKHYG